jgi:hypothetical protein
MLARKLDGSVIIADAIRKSACELELIETLIASLETRRDKTLMRIAQYRAELSAICTASDQLIESKVVELPRAATTKKTRRRQRADCKVVELDSAVDTKTDSAA